MAKKVTVTAAQKTAAGFIVARGSKTGRIVSSSVKKIASASEPTPAGKT